MMHKENQNLNKRLYYYLNFLIKMKAIESAIQETYNVAIFSLFQPNCHIQNHFCSEKGDMILVTPNEIYTTTGSREMNFFLKYIAVFQPQSLHLAIQCKTKYLGACAKRNFECYRDNHCQARGAK